MWIGEWYDVAAYRSRMLIGMLVVDIVVVGALLLWRPWTRRPDVVDFESVGRFSQGFGLVFLVTVALFLITAVLFLRWFKVVAQRAERTGGMRFRGAWWFWAWALPGVSLVLPKMMINDIWHAAGPPGRREPMPMEITRWWGLWVASGVIGYLPDGVTDLLVAPELAVYLVAAMVMGEAAFAIGLVRVVTERNTQLGPDPGPRPDFVTAGWPAPAQPVG